MTEDSRAERHARHLAEHTNQPIADARAALGLVGLTTEELSAGPTCAGCGRPFDGPHAPGCPLVMHTPLVGDVECDHPAAPGGPPCGRLMPCAIHQSLAQALDSAPERAREAAAEVARPSGGELCGEQFGDRLAFCTKAVTHLDKGDDAHYDHLAKRTWRVARSPKGLV